MSTALLTSLIFVPISFGAALLLPIARSNPRCNSGFALLGALVTLALSLLILFRFDPAHHGLQFEEIHLWVSSYSIYYHLAIDGISLVLILLTTVVSTLVIVVNSYAAEERNHLWMASFLILEGLMLGVFCAVDGVLFYLFWEAMLIPMFLIIGIWGGERRIYAAIKFFLYTFLGSVFMLVALVYLYTRFGTFNIFELHHARLGIEEGRWLFLAFFLAFAVKVPMWPVHTWLPDAHVEAPTGGSMILAAILLKMGAYGMLRFILPITTEASLHFHGVVVFLSLVAIIYIGLVALAQHDMKKLVAYSSVAHMGFVTLGFFILFSMPRDTTIMLWAIEGSFVQMISHGLISAALFFSIGVLYKRFHTRDIKAYGGVANGMPKFAAFVMFFAMANAGLPGTSGFVGEFMVVLASFQASFLVGLGAASSLVLCAAYTLWLYHRVFFGATRSTATEKLPGLCPYEYAVLIVLACLVLWIGLWPDPLMQYVRPASEDLLKHIELRAFGG